jgi:hypothetical protein
MQLEGRVGLTRANGAHYPSRQGRVCRKGGRTSARQAETRRTTSWEEYNSYVVTVVVEYLWTIRSKAPDNDLVGNWVLENKG